MAKFREIQSPGWFSRGALPEELRDGAARRLGILGLVTACTFVTFFFINVPLNIGRHLEPVTRVCTITAASFAFLLSLGIFILTRLMRSSPCQLLGVGIGYQLLMAAAIGFLNHLSPWDSVVQHQGWSGIAVWIIIYAVFVPNTPWRTLWVSTAVAATDPLALLATAALGNPMPAVESMPLIFGPTLIAVVTAVIAVRINVRISKQLQDVQQMGSYQLVELLGRGGMGEVWRAEHKMLARPAAIKLIRPEALAGEGAAADSLTRRFEREAQATAQLQSEHTIELYDYGVASDGAFYYVMELLDGLDQELLVKRFGPLPPARVIFMLRQICESLAEAHQRGLIHRDIKPSNIYVCRRGLRYDHVKLLDFGLVTAAPGERGDLATRLTADGSVTGTPAYMVPEIIEGVEPIDGRADLYAVGCVAYWLLTGKLVFEAGSAMKMVVSHASAEPPRLSERAEQSIPPALEELVHACLEKDPARRPASAQELSRRLAKVELDEAWSQERAREWWDAHLGASAAKPEAAEVDPMAQTAASE